MYWLVDTYTADTGTKYYTYNYFALVPTHTYKKAWFNGVTKSIIYPATHQIIIKALIVESEDQFLQFYNKTKNI